MDDYKPYGDEWEKEMMKLPKKALVDMVRRIKTDGYKVEIVCKDCQKKGAMTIIE